MTPPRPVLLVDGGSVGWRACHAGGGLAHRGAPTGMSYVFLRMVRDALERTGAGRCWVAWDAGVPPFRRELVFGYKVGRRRDDDPGARERAAEFAAQQRWLAGVLPALGLGQARALRWEADDVLAVLAGVCERRGESAVLLSSDRDLWQLVSNLVGCLAPEAKDGPITLANFAERTGARIPAEWLNMKALMGDASDGVPGVGGVGRARAARVVRGDFAGVIPAGSSPAAWWAGHRDAYERNLRVLRLEKDRRLDLERVPPRKDFPAARRALVRAGMHSLAADWVRWAEPFRVLGGRPWRSPGS